MGIAQKVAREFSDAVRSRGQSYFAKGRVAITASSAGEVVAKVRGTEKYKVRLRLRGDQADRDLHVPVFRAGRRTLQAPLGDGPGRRRPGAAPLGADPAAPPGHRLGPPPGELPGRRRPGRAATVDLRPPALPLAEPGSRALPASSPQPPQGPPRGPQPRTRRLAALSSSHGPLAGQGPSDPRRGPNEPRRGPGPEQDQRAATRPRAGLSAAAGPGPNQGPGQGQGPPSYPNQARGRAGPGPGPNQGPGPGPQRPGRPPHPKDRRARGPAVRGSTATSIQASTATSTLRPMPTPSSSSRPRPEPPGPRRRRPRRPSGCSPTSSTSPPRSRANQVVIDLARRARRPNGDWGPLKPWWHAANLPVGPLRPRGPRPPRRSGRGPGPSSASAPSTPTATASRPGPAGSCSGPRPRRRSSSGWRRTGRLRLRRTDGEDDPPIVRWDDQPPWRFGLDVRSDPTGKRWTWRGMLRRVDARGSPTGWTWPSRWPSCPAWSSRGSARSPGSTTPACSSGSCGSATRRRWPSPTRPSRTRCSRRSWSTRRSPPPS